MSVGSVIRLDNRNVIEPVNFTGIVLDQAVQLQRPAKNFFAQVLSANNMNDAVDDTFAVFLISFEKLSIPKAVIDAGGDLRAVLRPGMNCMSLSQWLRHNSNAVTDPASVPFPEMHLECPVTDLYVNSFGVRSAGGAVNVSTYFGLDVTLLCSSFLKKLSGQPSGRYSVGS